MKCNAVFNLFLQQFMIICTDSPKASGKSQRTTDSKKSLLQRRQLSLQARKNKRARDIVVVKPATDTQLDEDIRRLQVDNLMHEKKIGF